MAVQITRKVCGSCESLVSQCLWDFWLLWVSAWGCWLSRHDFFVSSHRRKPTRSTWFIVAVYFLISSARTWHSSSRLRPGNAHDRCGGVRVEVQGKPRTGSTDFCHGKLSLARRHCTSFWSNDTFSDHGCIEGLIYLFSDCWFHSSIDWVIEGFTDFWFHSLIDWLIDWLRDLLIVDSSRWFIHQAIGCFIYYWSSVCAIFPLRSFLRISTK